MRLQTYQGRVRLKNGRLLVGPDDECCCTCRQCVGRTPRQVQVTIAGMANFIYSDCTTGNGTFVLDRGNYGPDSDCIWTYVLESGFGSGGLITHLRLGLVWTGSVQRWLVAWQSADGLTILIGWGENPKAMPMDCTWDNFEVPFLGGAACVHPVNDPTCHITAL